MTATLVHGKAKIIHPTDNETVLIAEFKDDLTAFNSKKKSSAENKGLLNAQISEILFNYLEKNAIKTHLISREENKLTIQKLSMIPVEVVVRNIATGSLSRNYNIPKGKRLDQPIVEYYLKNDDLDDPPLNEDHIFSFNLVRKREDIQTLKRKALDVNSVLIAFFRAANLELVDFKLEFGYAPNGSIILGDEMSPDNMRLWDIESGSSLDKDNFREDTGNVIDSYTEVLQRITVVKPTYSEKKTYSMNVLVSPRKDILDPQGKAAEHSLHAMGFKNIANIRVGKYIQLNITAESRQEAEETLKTASEKLLSNPVIEDFAIQYSDSGPAHPPTAK